MTEEPTRSELPDNRREPVGAPVVRGDPEIAGARAEQAAAFDPDDPGSLAEAEAVVREFVNDPDARSDNLLMLRGAAACAALVRGTGSYTAAAERAGNAVTVDVLRTWARVHDLPISIRRHIARGDIHVSAASQIARVSGSARFLMAWAILDHDLSVDEVRRVASAVIDGESVKTALERVGVSVGTITITLPAETYRELRRAASGRSDGVDGAVDDAVRAWLSDGVGDG